MRVFSDKRERKPDEIIPASAIQSATMDRNHEDYAAAHAIDLYLMTSSYTRAGPDGSAWLKVKLDKVYCVQEVAWYGTDGSPVLTWTCSSSDCTTCTEGSSSCTSYNLTVSTDRTSTDGLIPVSDCRYGDTVKLNGGKSFRVFEIAITGKPGEGTFCDETL